MDPIDNTTPNNDEISDDDQNIEPNMFDLMEHILIRSLRGHSNGTASTSSSDPSRSSGHTFFSGTSSVPSTSSSPTFFGGTSSSGSPNDQNRHTDITQLLPLLMSMQQPTLLHSHCSICQQFETAVKDHIVIHAKRRLNPEIPVNTDDVDTLKDVMVDLWFDHHIEDAMEAFTIQNERRDRIERFIQSTMDMDKPPAESATDDMISSLSVNQCEEKTEESCSICLMQFDVGDEILKTKCEHGFHKMCIETWLKTNIKCPLCRCNAITGEIMET